MFRGRTLLSLLRRVLEPAPLIAPLSLSLTCVSAGLLPNHPHLPTQARTVFPGVAVRPSAIPSSALAIWQYASVTLTCASPVGPQSTGTARWCLAKTAASSVASKR